MASMFKPKVQQVEMPKPKPKRMPVETDPEVLAAGERAKKSAFRRSGRSATIMTNRLKETTGSSGQKLGA